MPYVDAMGYHHSSSKFLAASFAQCDKCVPKGLL